MFQSKAVAFLYCVSPVHMGAGTAIGAIDNPIQRERHTGHPMMAGSGIKGALRHHWWAQLDLAGRSDGRSIINRIFGPEKEAADHAGAVSFADAQLVLFPVRSLKNAFVYVTSPTALARLERLLRLAGHGGELFGSIPSPGDEACAVCNDRLLSGSRKSLILESYELLRDESLSEQTGKIARWLSTHAMPAGNGFDYFRQKLANDLVVLSDRQLSFFVQHATVVEPHVRINDESGTADDGGLFFTENLPAESLLVTLAMASQERRKQGNGGSQARDERGSGTQGPTESVRAMSSDEVLRAIRDGVKDTAVTNTAVKNTGIKGLDDALVQIGGDATTGRGQVVVHMTSPS